MPHLLLPDQETAEEALARTWKHHAQNAMATWRDQGFVSEAVEKANQCLRTLVELFPERWNIKP